MSHFVVVVLGDDPDELLAPYDENLEVPEYEDSCWCVNEIASRAAYEDNADALQEIRDSEEIMRTELRMLSDEANRIPQVAEVGFVLVGIGKKFDHYISVVGELPELLELRDREKELAQRWFASHDRREAIIKAATEAHPMHKKPDPDCQECGGTGKVMTTSNPDGQWDWYQVGGRWTGWLEPEYEPHMDPRNTEQCMLCVGHPGKRYFRKEVLVEPEGLDAVFAQEEDGVHTVMRPTIVSDPLAEEVPCNGCDGTGIAQKWPTEWVSHGDVQPIERYLELLNTEGVDVIPYALVTPDGTWHARAKMGWFGVTLEEKASQDEWADQVREIVAHTAETFPGTKATVVDCHV